MNPNITYIALWGKKKAGKTTVAKQLHSELLKQGFKNVVRISFAEKLRKAYDLFFPNTPKWLDLDSETKEAHRPFMQICGDACKAVDDAYFAKDLVATIESEWEMQRGLDLGPHLYVIVDDLRYAVEAEAMANSGRLITVRLYSELENNDDTHASESHGGLADITTITHFNQLGKNEGYVIMDSLGSSVSKDDPNYLYKYR